MQQPHAHESPPPAHDDGEVEGDADADGGGVLGDTFGGAARALLRIKRTGTLRGVRVKGKSAQAALERLGKAADVADLVSEARTAPSSAGKLVTAARSYATSFGLGTLLYGTYEHAADALDSHVAAGALAGAAHGAAAHVTGCESLPKTRAAVAGLLRGVPRAAAIDSGEYAVLFGSYAALKRRLTGSVEEPISAHKQGRTLVFDARAVAAVLGAGGAAGSLQAATSQLLKREPLQLRAILKAAPLSGIGFGAFELGNALARHHGGGE